MDEMMSSPVAEILMKVLPWVDEANREAMIAELAPGAAELVGQLYAIHEVNGTGD